MNNNEFKKKIGRTIKEVSYLRGDIITSAINIEGGIDAIILNYFIDQKKPSDFTGMVLSDSSFTFGLKLKIFKKILGKIELDTYPEFKDDLYRIMELRNRFAHSFMFGFDGHLSYPAGEQLKNKKAVEMHKEFMSLYLRANEELEKIFWFVIGKEKPEMKR